jgi:hypothetical protein
MGWVCRLKGSNKKNRRVFMAKALRNVIYEKLKGQKNNSEMDLKQVVCEEGCIYFKVMTNTGYQQ